MWKVGRDHVILSPCRAADIYASALWRSGPAPVSAPSASQLIARSESQLNAGHAERAATDAESALYQLLDGKSKSDELIRSADLTIRARERLGQLALTVHPWEVLRDSTADPGSLRPDLLPRLGWAYLAAGEFELAKQTFEKRTEKVPDDPNALLGLSELSLLAQEPSQAAQRAFGVLLRVKESNRDLAEQARSRIDRAIAAVARNVPDRALRMIDELSPAAALPQDREVWKLLALTLGKRPAEAEKLADQLRSRYSRDARLLFALAILKAEQGRTSEALAAFEAVKSVDPGNLAARISLGGLRLQLGPSSERDRGMHELQAISRAHPGSSDVRRALIRVGFPRLDSHPPSSPAGPPPLVIAPLVSTPPWMQALQGL